jgi:hypothetical protein
MWQQFLAHPECKAVSLMKPTMLHFPSTLRSNVTIDERLVELNSWAQRLRDKHWYEGFVHEILDKCIQSGARTFVAYQHAVNAYQNFEREYQNVTHESQKVLHAYQNVERVLQDRESELKMVQGRLQDQQRGFEKAQVQLQNIYGTFTWRLVNRLLKFPIIGSLIKWVGKVLADKSTL